MSAMPVPRGSTMTSRSRRLIVRRPIPTTARSRRPPHQPLLLDDGAGRRSLVSVTLSPLLNAAPAIQIHAFAAIAAFAVGAVQLSAPKGTIPHRLIGWLWAVLMMTVAISSLFIHEIRLWGPWSPIH